jgi:chemotaxis protein methyltransferase CheR
VSSTPESDLRMVARASGISLLDYAPQHVAGCLQRALLHNGVPTAQALAERLSRDRRARDVFRRSVLVGVTRMFRDEQEFALLERRLLPELLARRRSLSVWAAGCSTGEELRSVAVLLERRGALAGSHLLGTDILDESVLAAARDAAELPPTARSAIRFEQQDLISASAPAARFDLVLCRNVAIYFTPAVQRRLQRRLVAALRPGGFLMLGHSETVLDTGAAGLEAVSRHAFRKAAA